MRSLVTCVTADELFSLRLSLLIINIKNIRFTSHQKVVVKNNVGKIKFVLHKEGSQTKLSFFLPPKVKYHVKNSSKNCFQLSLKYK